MFDNNTLRDAKNYWKYYYRNITEGWNDEVEDVTGFKWIGKDHDQYDPKHDPNGHGHHFYNEQTGEKMSQDEVMKLYDSKKKKPWTSGDPDSDPDFKEGRYESLFHKDNDRLLREHIRSEYEARGIYPTSREVQETYNHVVNLLEKTRASERDARLAKLHGTSGTAKGLELTKQELRRQRAGYPKQDFGNPRETSRVESKRKAKHDAARGVATRVSPSSPARKQSQAEVDTRFLMGQGFSAEHLRRIMSNTGR
jgi:hypothetical protein